VDVVILGLGKYSGTSGDINLTRLAQQSRKFFPERVLPFTGADGSRPRAGTRATRPTSAVSLCLSPTVAAHPRAARADEGARRSNGRRESFSGADRFVERPESGVVLSPRLLRAAVGLPGKFRPAKTSLPTAFARVPERSASASVRKGRPNCRPCAPQTGALSWVRISHFLEFIARRKHVCPGDLNCLSRITRPDSPPRRKGTKRDEQETHRLPFCGDKSRGH